MKCPQCNSDNPDTSRFCGNCAAFLNPEKFISITKNQAKPFQKLEEGTLFAKKYRIGGEIGRGGMGVVYRAEDTKLRRVVALKFLPQELMRDKEAKERFVQEAQAAAALDHPNICTVYEINESGGQTFISMAYIQGQSLKEKIAAGPIELGEVLDIAIHTAEGLKEAHENGIVHRDIKPANIMLTAKGQVKIMDFGLAKLSWGVDLTKTATIMGTVAYMSPEQAKGEKIDHKTDIWSLGCVLYEMLAGQRPFKSTHDQAAIYSILNEEPEPIASLRKDLPVGFEMILHACLQKDPRNRYRNMEALLSDLRSMDLEDKTQVLTAVHAKEESPSIAVLPFVNMSAEAENEYFSDGLSEAIINSLTKIRDFKVVARTSAFSFKGKDVDIRDIGRKLDVNKVLEGSVQKAGNRLRITAQLINVIDGYHLWSERFDRNIDDVFVIQDEISLSVVESLKVTLRVGERTALKKRSTDDADAYNLYLKGLYFAARPDAESLGKALNFFQEALDRDPNFALANAGMALVFVNLGVMNLAPPTEVLPKAKAALQKALSLDEDLAEAHAQAAALAFWFEWDWEATEKSLGRVLALNPGDAFSHGTYSWYLLSKKRFDEAIRAVKKTLSLDPLMPLYYAWSVGIHTATGRYDEALQEFTKAKEIDPKLGLAYFHAGGAYALKGDFDAAIETLEKSIEFGVYSGWAEAFLTLVYLKKGEKEKAARAFKEQLAEIEKTTPSFTSLAWQAAALGNFDLAFEFLDKAYERRDLLMPYILVYTDLFAPALQRDLRFKGVLAKMKLVD
jgi:serine/threonine protein kinase